jgi:hypothetical protein
MNVDDRLRRLSPSPASAPAVPVEEIMLTGRRLRTRRRMRWSAGIGALGAIGALALIVPNVGSGAAGPGTQLLAAGPAAAAGGGVPSQGCVGLPVDQARDVPELEYTFSAAPQGMSEVLSRARTGRGCGSAATPLAVASVDRGRVVRSFAVWGPRADDSSLGDPTGTTRVRGVRANLYRGDAAGGADGLSWTEPDGGAWLVTSSGLTQADLIRLTERLELDARSGTAALDDAALRSFDVSESHVDPSPPNETTVWTVLYSSPQDAQVALTVERSHAAPLADAAWPGAQAQVVAVRGSRGVYQGALGTGTASLSWAEDGLTLQLTVNQSERNALPDLLALAESLVQPAGSRPQT